ncbi:MAG: SOS response-associated peptidase [Planctomycetota bacterium]
MCGRFSLTPDRASIVDEFNIGVVTDLDHINVTERYNVAPTQPVAVVLPPPAGRADAGRVLTAMRWGIIPQWMKPQPSGKTPPGWINARAETAPTKPAFRGAFKYRRCVVPASGFYEWEKRSDGPKQPWLIRAADDKTMGFAGLWETWCPPDGSELHTVTILTTGPNTMMREIHGRMPVILDPEDYDRWMTIEPARAHELEGLLAPAIDGTVYKTAITTRVNSVRHDDPECWSTL